MQVSATIQDNQIVARKVRDRDLLRIRCGMTRGPVKAAEGLASWPIGILKAACFAKVFQEIGMWVAVAAQLWTYMKPWITHWFGGLREMWGIFQVKTSWHIWRMIYW